MSNGQTRSGTVLQAVSGLYRVMSEGEVLECTAGGRLRLKAEAPLPGDRVVFERKERGALITEIMPRQNALSRPPLANIDKLFLVVTQAAPVTDPYMIDKMTVIALFHDIEPVILLNKSDLHPNDGLCATYAAAGFAVWRVSAQTGEGIGRVRDAMCGCVCAVTGNSGVGKSSILNRIDRRFALQTAEISDRIRRGRHTTRAVTFLELPGGGYVADTPGFSSFDVAGVEKIEKDSLQHYFPEIAAHFGKCRFSGCAHIKEPDCAVREAVHSGRLDAGRYENYVRLYEELGKIAFWER